MVKRLPRPGAHPVARHQHELAAPDRLLHPHRRLHADLLDGVQGDVRGVEVAHEHPREYGIVPHLLEGVDVGDLLPRIPVRRRQGGKDLDGTEVGGDEERALPRGDEVPERTSTGIVAHGHLRQVLSERAGVRLVRKRPGEAEEVAVERPRADGRRVLPSAKRRKHGVVRAQRAPCRAGEGVDERHHRHGDEFERRLPASRIHGPHEPHAPAPRALLALRMPRRGVPAGGSHHAPLVGRDVLGAPHTLTAEGEDVGEEKPEGKCDAHRLRDGERREGEQAETRKRRQERGAHRAARRRPRPASVEDHVVEPQPDHHEEAEKREARERNPEPPQHPARRGHRREHGSDVQEEPLSEEGEEEDGEQPERHAEKAARGGEEPREEPLQRRARIEDFDVRIRRNESRRARRDKARRREAERRNEAFQRARRRHLRIEKHVRHRPAGHAQPRQRRVARPLVRGEPRGQGRVLALAADGRDDRRKPLQPRRLLMFEARLQGVARDERNPCTRRRTHFQEPPLARREVGVRPVEGRRTRGDVEAEEAERGAAQEKRTRPAPGPSGPTRTRRFLHRREARSARPPSEDRHADRPQARHREERHLPQGGDLRTEQRRETGERRHERNPERTGDTGHVPGGARMVDVVDGEADERRAEDER